MRMKIKKKIVKIIKKIFKIKSPSEYWTTEYWTVNED